MPAPPPPPPPMAPPMASSSRRKQLPAPVDPEAGRNALLEDIRNGPRLRSVPKPREKNIFVISNNSNDHNNNGNCNSNDDHISVVENTSDSGVRRNPLSAELQAELTSTLKRRQNHENDEKVGIRTFNPNILNSHVPQPTGFKIGHAGPNFKIQSMKRASPDLKDQQKENGHTAEVKTTEPNRLQEARKMFQTEMKSPEPQESRKVEIKSPPRTPEPSLQETRKVFQVLNETKTQNSLPQPRKPQVTKTFKHSSGADGSHVQSRNVNLNNQIPGATSSPRRTPEPQVVRVSAQNTIKSPLPKSSSAVTDTRHQLVRITSMEKPQTEKLFIKFHEPTFEKEPEGIKPELLSPKSEVRFQIGSAKSDQMNNKPNGDEVDQLASRQQSMEPLEHNNDKMEQSRMNIKKFIQRLNSTDDSTERSGTLPRANKTYGDVKTNSLRRDNGHQAYKISHPRANFTIQNKIRSPSPVRAINNSSINVQKSAVQTKVIPIQILPVQVTQEVKQPQFVMQKKDDVIYAVPRKPQPLRFSPTKSMAPSPPISPRVHSPSLKPMAPSPPLRMTPSPSSMRSTPSPVQRSFSPEPIKQSSNLYRSQVSIEHTVVPASPPPPTFINGKAAKTPVTVTKSVPSLKKRPAPKPPLTPTISSPTSPLSPNKSSLFSAYNQTLSGQNSDLHDSGIDVNFEAKQQVSFSKDLVNSPNNYIATVETSEIVTKREEIYYEGVNLRGLKLDINDRNSVRVMPK